MPRDVPPSDQADKPATEIVRDRLVEIAGNAPDRTAAIKAFAAAAIDTLPREQILVLIEAGAQHLLLYKPPADRPPSQHAVRDSARPASAPPTLKASQETWSPPVSTGDRMAARLRIVAPKYDWTLPNGADLLSACSADLELAIAASKKDAQRSIGLVKVYATIKATMEREGAAIVGDLYTPDQILQLRTQHGVSCE